MTALPERFRFQNEITVWFITLSIIAIGILAYMGTMALYISKDEQAETEYTIEKYKHELISTKEKLDEYKKRFGPLD
jgi:hypothetical protein